MLLLFHIVVALASLAVTALTFLVPSKVRIRLSQGLIALTLVSGTYLVVSSHANMVHACIMGLIYVAIVTFGVLVADHKLSAQENER